jgi:hypothetical protein
MTGRTYDSWLGVRAWQRGNDTIPFILAVKGTGSEHVP